VTAIGVVASEPAGPPGGAPDQAAAAPALPETTRTLTGTHVQTGAPGRGEDPVTPPATAPARTDPENSVVGNESDAPGEQTTTGKPAKEAKSGQSVQTGQQGQAGQQGQSAAAPAKPKKPKKNPKPEPPGQAKK
jgi:hypothetical protein